MNRKKVKSAEFNGDQATVDVARGLGADHIRHVMIYQKNTFFEAESVAKKMNASLAFFKQWAKDKNVRSVNGYYNLRDVGALLIAALYETQSLGGLTGNWSTWGTQFFLGKYDIFANAEARPIYIIARPQNDETVKWSINAQLDPGWALTKDMEWIFEPPPSERTADYINSTRYDTKEAALKHFVAFKDHLIDSGIFYYE